jgi:Family of unknown function (DUF5757)
MEFENDESILLKKAQELKVPTRFVKVLKDEDSYIDMTKEIEKLIPTKISLLNLYEKFKSVELQDLVMLYTIYKKDENPEEVLKEINQLYELLNLNTIQNTRELYDFMLPSWEKKFVETLEIEEEKLEDILAIQEEMEKFPPLFHSPIKIFSTIVYADMKFKNEKIPTINDGYEIFDFSKPDEILPFIRWNTNLPNPNNRELFKIYTGKTMEERPEYSKIFPTREKDISNSFTFSVSKNIKEDKSFLKGTYSLETNLLKIKIPREDIDDKEKILQKISDVFPLVPEKINEKSIAGELFIFDVDVNDLILSDMVLNDEFMNNYLFMKEMTTPFALKNQTKLFFRSVGSLSLDKEEESSSVAFILSQNFAKGGEIVTIIRNGKEEKIKLRTNTPYVGIRITSADSLETAESFVKIFSRLLSRYKEVKDETENIYKLFIPEFEEEKEIASTSMKIKGLPETKILKLQQEAPELFIPGYARKCPNQPIVISNDEVEDWKRQTFLYKNKEIERQTLDFILEDGTKLNFGCPGDEYPFPGFKKNNLENKEIYPNLPCCYKTEKISKFFKEEEEEEEGLPPLKPILKKTEHVIGTDKILDDGRFGILPDSIIDLLKNVIGKKEEIRRRGVPRTLNSILHCIHIAIKDEKYLDKSEKERNIYIDKIRKEISKSIYPGLCKQEMYDFTNDEIIKSLGDEFEFLDPDLYFRALEEVYNINIFVFAPSKDEVKRLKNKEKSTGVIQLPRFKLFSARSPHPERYSILIYRTMGSESTATEYPQCELIVNKDDSLFGEKMHDLLFEAILNINNIITWELVLDGSQLDILARDNIYSRLNFYMLTNKTATKQYIDDFGKMRGLYINNILMIFPPSAPENLLISTEIVSTSLEEVLKVFDNPVGVSLNSDKNIDGLWFSVLDIVYGIYVPIIPTKNNLKLPIGPENPLGEKGGEITPRIRKIKRDLDFIFQTLKWLFSLSKIPLDNFINEYTIIGGDIKEDSSKIYDLRNIGRTFPDVKTIEEGIEEMKKRVPSLFMDDRLFLYSEKFFNGIYYLMKQYTKEYVKNFKNMRIPKMITRKYLTEQDFISYEGIAIFLSEFDMKTWLASLEKTSEIYSTLNHTYSGRTEPYMYIAPDGHIYLIQNVIEGDLQRALNVGFYWKEHKVNPGFRSHEYDEEENPKYVVYNISQANTIVLGENNAGDSLSFYSVLRYNTFPPAHAAMLLLL